MAMMNPHISTVPSLLFPFHLVFGSVYAHWWCVMAVVGKHLRKVLDKGVPKEKW
jgi:hypothetical protein